MVRSLKNVAPLTFLTLLLCFVKGAQAQTSVLSADDTVAYINGTLHKYPTLEFVDSGCPGYEQVVGISGDRRSLIITQTFGKSTEGRCSDVQTLTVPVFSLNQDGLGGWSKQGQHTSLFLDCINRVDCFSRRSDPGTFASAENEWRLKVTAPDEISRGLRTAIKHLVGSLLSEATARIDGSDLFAKRAH